MVSRGCIALPQAVEVDGEKQDEVKKRHFFTNCI
jgi:hypothetical protein